MRKFMCLSLVAVILLYPIYAICGVITRLDINQVTQKGNTLYAFFDVTDENAEMIQGLTADDIFITLGNIQQTATVSSLSETDMGVGYVFAVDISKSLTGDQFEQVRVSLHQWIDKMGENDMAALLTFGESITVLSDYSDDKTVLQNIVDQIQLTDNNTMLYNGVQTTIDLARRQGEYLPLCRIAVVLSDGIDDYPTGATLTELTEKAGNSGVPIYILGVDNGKNQTQLNELGGIARLSGGDLYLSSQDISGTYDSIYQRIGSGYIASIVLPQEQLGTVSNLMITASMDGISVKDNTDIRLDTVVPEENLNEPVAAITTSLPSETQPSSTTVVPEMPTTETNSNNTLVYIVIALLTLCGLAALMMLVRGRKSKEKMPLAQTVDEVLSSGSTAIKTERVDSARGGEKTELLIGNGLPQEMLTLTDKRNGSQYTTIIKGRISIGRDSDNTIIIDETVISGHHCFFYMENNTLYLEDNNSTNYTSLSKGDGYQRVYEGTANRRSISNGDKLKLAEYEFDISITLS